MSNYIGISELDQIYNDAVGKDAAGNPQANVNTLGPVGACIAVTYGNPDQCRELRKGECDYVDAQLKKKQAGKADWQKGHCPI
ncbi:hypothetical protein RFM41_10325 [Mesorhizobium sp. VK25A]|uniref:Uncharacterized protein n=1 Tax=Mesorhizobium vachelliae TaxID=3072309 RepID=A0ABU4ZWI2_9HYPH|nr:MULTISPECIES: hypothetical protein [unclassified Mesorhizobium]MDX8529739.1 hypothetical protein [Mesorhizobium sp. VK25D]MDX8544137.1 hypothetical protein [Mesorhizobium sp. VK25A]